MIVGPKANGMHETRKHMQLILWPEANKEPRRSVTSRVLTRTGSVVGAMKHGQRAAPHKASRREGRMNESNIHRNERDPKVL